MREPIRLAKRVVELFGCSRSEAERHIENGAVRVDGVVVEQPQHRVANETVTLDAERAGAPDEPVTLLLHKPVGYAAGDGANPAAALLTVANRAADDDPDVRTLARHFRGLSAPTPLDDDASGLVVYSQDFRIVRKLVDDADRLEHELVVEVAGALIPHGLKRLNHGLMFNGRPLAPCKVSWQNETHLRFAIKAVRPGQIAHMCERVGLQALNVRRIRIGRVPLARLPSGQWRYLRADERF